MRQSLHQYPAAGPFVNLSRFTSRLSRRAALLAVATSSLAACWSTLARADDYQSARDLYRSAYFLGRGDTGVAIADYEDAIFYNPAGLAYGKGIYKQVVLLSPTVEVSQATRDLAAKIAARNSEVIDTVEGHVGRPDHVGVQNFTGVMFRRAALGVIASSHADLLAARDANAGGLESISAAADASAGVTFTLAQDFFSDHLFIGVTGKFLQRGRGLASANASEINTVKEKFADKSSFIASGQGGGADVGIMFRGGGRTDPAIGITVNDVGNTNITPTTETDLYVGLRQTVNVGLAVSPGTKFSKIRLLADCYDALGAVYKDAHKRAHLGGELSVKDTVGVTGGVNQGYPTGGFFFDVRVFRLDVGAYSQEIGSTVGTRPDTRYFARIRAGF